MKRIFDLVASFFGLLVLSPFLIGASIAVWLQDFNSPYYFGERVGKDEQLFWMVKLRSMVKNADKSGVDSTSANDMRITPIGHFIRRYKLDEFTQLWNVFWGQMSLVGPRPNVKRETDLYTPDEKKLLKVKPGITDFSSIVFSDEGDILADSKDPDLDYNQLIRPWKSRLGIFYVENRSLLIDIRIVIATVVAILSREKALRMVYGILQEMSAPQELLQVVLRNEPLVPTPPPGSDRVVTSRGI